MDNSKQHGYFGIKKGKVSLFKLNSFSEGYGLSYLFKFKIEYHPAVNFNLNYEVNLYYRKTINS